MEPGSDEAYRDVLDRELVYEFNTPYHGATPKRSLEGPQICTQAKEVAPEVIRGKDFVAVRMSFTYTLAAPGKATGSKWTQTIVFPQGTRYFISSDRIDAVNSSDAMFLRIDMPGHVKHNQGDSFSEIYLSYLAQTNQPIEDATTIPSSAFLEDFARRTLPLSPRQVPSATRPVHSRVSAPRPQEWRARPLAGRHDAGSGDCARSLVPPARLRLHDRGVWRAAHPSRRVVQRCVHRWVL